MVSAHLHAHLQAGSVLEAAAPRGDFVLPDDDETGPVLLLSAGIGVTPVLAMLHTLATANSPRDIWWLHTARSSLEHAFATEVHDLLQHLAHSHEHIYYTAQTAMTDQPATITLGRLNRDALIALDLPTNATVYMCGPGGFMTAMREALVELGFDPGHIHSELFGTLPAISPGLTDLTHPAPHQPPGPAGTGPHITFARSGLTVPWNDGYATILEFAEACDVPTRWSCRSGVCHTCKTPILSGSVRYNPQPLENPATGSVLVCCSRPESDVVLDL